MRLIDADALKANFQDELCGGIACRECSLREENDCKAERWIDNAPTIEAEPIVRCKDCADWVRNFTDRAKPNVHPCRAVGHPTTADFFCGLGERMDEVEE